MDVNSRFPTSIIRPITVADDPIHNLLNSLSLINKVEQLPALPASIKQIAADMTAELQMENLLFADVCHELLLPTLEPSSVADYLHALERQDAEAARDRYLKRVSTSLAGRVQFTSETLLADRDTFVSWMRMATSASALDEAVLGRAWVLLQEPITLHQRAASHLRTMWEQYLRPMWQTMATSASREVNTLRHRLEVDPGVERNLRRFLEHELSGTYLPSSSAIQEIICVPSAHAGRYVIARQQGTRLRVFFDVGRNFAVVVRTTPIERTELLLRVSALSDETRLQIIELFADQDEIGAQEIMQRLGLSQSSVSRHLKQLFPYLVESRAGGANKVYRVSPAQFDLTNDAIKRLLAPAVGSMAVVEDVGDLRRFMNRQGLITMFPAQRRDKKLVLDYIAARFETGRFYTEKEVNELISQQIAFDDFVTLRRELFNNHYLNRERDGSRYWRQQQE